MKITLYSTNCPKCVVLKKKLISKGVEFEINNNVDTMIDLGFSSTPMLCVDGKTMDFTEANKWVNSL